MLRGRAPRCSQSGAHHHGHSPVPARHVVGFRRLVDHLIHGKGDEVAKHDVDDGTQAGHRRADSDSRETSFGDRRVHHALRAKFFH